MKIEKKSRRVENLSEREFFCLLFNDYVLINVRL